MENSLSGNGDSEIVGTEGDNTSKMHPKNFGPSSTVGRTDSIETFGEQVSQLFQADKKQNVTEAKNLRIKLAKFTGSGAQPANNSILECSRLANLLVLLSIPQNCKLALKRENSGAKKHPVL